MGAFRTSNLAEYVAWLSSWLAEGHRPTHYYDYPFAQQTWLTAERDFRTGGECGSESANIIVPADIRHLGGEIGHNTLYFADGPELVGSFVPVFVESVFRDIPGVVEFIADQEEKQRKFERNQRARRAARKNALQSSDVSRHFGRTTE